jgi:hypothetical protein
MGGLGLLAKALGPLDGRSLACSRPEQPAGPCSEKAAGPTSEPEPADPARLSAAALTHLLYFNANPSFDFA